MTKKTQFIAHYLFFTRLKLLLLWFAMTIVVIAPMLEQSYPITHSVQFNLSWGFQYQKQFFSGQFYPRWLEYSNFGFGNPTFAFYPPMCMVTTLPFRLLGFGLIASLIGSMSLAIALLGLGIYLYARNFMSLKVSLAVALITMTAPYFLVDIYHRGAIGEVWAIASLPWILLTTERIICYPQQKWRIIPLAISYTCLILSNLSSLLIFTPLLLILPWFYHKKNNLKQSVKNCYLGLLLAFGWTSFYLFPAILDQRFIQVESLHPSDEYRPQNRLIIFGLLSLKPKLTNHWFDQQLITLWFLMILVVIITLIVRIFLKLNYPRRLKSIRLKNIVWYWLLISAFALLIQTEILGWLYLVIPTLQKIQFSWRYLIIPTITIPLLLGYLLETTVMRVNYFVVTKNKKLGIRHKKLFNLGFTSLVLIIMGISIYQGMVIVSKANFNPQDIDRFISLAEKKEFPQEPQKLPGEAFLHWHWILDDGLALVDVPEYRARDVSLGMPPNRIYPLLEWEHGGKDYLQVEKWQYGLREFSALNISNQPKKVLLRTFYYPAWKVEVDGKKVMTEKSNLGQLQVTIPTGNHQIKVKYSGTFADGLGILITGLTGLILFLLLGRRFFLLNTL